MCSTLILASASPRRLDLLAQIGITPSEVCPANIDETPHKNELPEHYAQRLASEKAHVVNIKKPGKTILAADTVVYCGRRILPKAEDDAMARQCLEILSGRRHRVGTAVAVLHNGIIKTRLTVTHVRFKKLSVKEIEVYVASGEWNGKAGGYAIQGKAGAFIPFINGSYSNVVGLPLAETKLMLEAAGLFL